MQRLTFSYSPSLSQIPQKTLSLRQINSVSFSLRESQLQLVQINYSRYLVTYQDNVCDNFCISILGSPKPRENRSKTIWKVVMICLIMVMLMGTPTHAVLLCLWVYFCDLRCKMPLFLWKEVNKVRKTSWKGIPELFSCQQSTCSGSRIHI